MAEQMRGPSISLGGPLLILFVFGLAAAAGFGFYLAATGKLRALAPGLFASGGELQMPLEPQRGKARPEAAAGAAPSLAEMPPLADPAAAQAQSSSPPPSSQAVPATDAADPVTEAYGTDAGGADAWPDIGPAALLARAAAIPDRALSDAAFDLPPWHRYARPAAAASGPLLGILVTGNGLDPAVAAAAIAGLPAEVTLSFSPYAENLADWIAAARAFGHETLIDLPMQSRDFPARDPGPLGLLTALNAEELARRIDAMADSGSRSIGFASAGGDALLRDDAVTMAVLAEIRRLGLGFVETGAEPTSLAAADAGDIGVPFARMTVRLDEGAPDAVAARLAVAAKIARQRNAALAVTQASPLSITAIAAWARRQDQLARLVPVSALLQH
jgi:polysaccharide deacetylase 2 family uncharacterized protein YibQ